MEQSGRCLCALYRKLRKWLKSSCDQNKASYIPMGIKNAVKNGGGGHKKRTIENDLVCYYFTYRNNSFTVRKIRLLHLLNATVILKFETKLSKYESNKNCRSKSHFSPLGI